MTRQKTRNGKRSGMILGHCNEPHSGLVALLTGLPALLIVWGWIVRHVRSWAAKRAIPRIQDNRHK